MSAPEDKKDPSLFPDDFDWDSALAEWDKAPFVPEIAKEQKQKEPPKPPRPQPIYQPPRDQRGPVSTKPAIDPAQLTGLTDDEEEPETKSGQDPLRGQTPAPTTRSPLPRPAGRLGAPPPRGPSRGGLGHLFSRRDEPAPVDVDLSDLEQSGEQTAKQLQPEDDGSVYTSARDVPTASNPVAEPLRRPSLIDTGENVPEGAMFDPFVEPENPRNEQPTVHPRGASSPDLTPPPVVPKAPAMPEIDEPADEGDEVREDELLADAEPKKLLEPEVREHDPDAETQVGDAEKLGIAAALADVRGRRDADRPKAAPSAPPVSVPPPLPPEARPVVKPAPMHTWDDERPAHEWLPDEVRATVIARSEWIEAEARALDDLGARSRGLLVASELCALAGDRERAQALAREAHKLATSSPIAQRQARALAARDEMVELFAASAKHAPTAAAKLHDTLFAFELLRSEDEDGAQRWLKSASAIQPLDARVVFERASSALANNKLDDPSLVIKGDPVLSSTIDSVLRLRGVPRGEASDSPNDAARRARDALEKGDIASATRAIGELRTIPELAHGASWLGATIGALDPTARDLSTEWLRELAKSDDLARRALAARGLETGDVSMVEDALASADMFNPEERLSIAALAGARYARFAHDLDALEAKGNPALVSAAEAVLGASDRAAEDQEIRARAIATFAQRSPGEPGVAALVRLARLLVDGGDPNEIAAAIDSAESQAPAEARALRLNQALADGRAAEVCAALASWGESETKMVERALAAGLVAERANLAERALQSYQQALDLDVTCEAAMRAVASLDTSIDLPELLGRAAEKSEGIRAALFLLEAYSRSGDVGVLLPAHAAAPAIPIASFLAERAARHAGDVDAVLRWIRERRANENDPLELAMDAVREALLIADSDPNLASELLEQAHRARPKDVALRELYERLATDPPTDRAAWREKRAAALDPPSNVIMLTEAAHEYERAGDHEGALRAASAALAAGGGSLARAVLERAEIASGQTSRLADELLSLARGAEDVHARREAYERLAHLDATGRNDPASALLWHRTILEETPLHLPSLRHIEHAFIGERRDEELEPIASAIAKALAGQGDPECAAHGELAVRLRLRIAGDWAGTREMSELVAREPDPPLWALRMANAHARSRGDKESMLATTEALVARAGRPSEISALCLRAAEAALALGRAEEATQLLERATSEDPGDVVAWSLLAAAHKKAGNATKAAEAYESLARTSVVPAHQLEAWYEAATLWPDPDRSVAALEAAAALDLNHADVFQRLLGIYASRGAHAELAKLLERKIATITDPDERVAIEVQRGKALTDAGELEEANKAFEAALALRPDHVPALMAAAELSGKSGDWERAEQSLVQLARLVQDPADQKAIYTRLGEIYSTHLVNLSRAELAYKEVLKRSEGDVETLERLVEIYKRQNDAARALETQQELIAKAPDHQAKRKRLIELAHIHETVSHDLRKAEQTLEAARREFAGDVMVLRALAEFYLRQKQMPALNILLDRAVADAKRAFAGGRFTPALFETVATAYEMRDRKDAARVVQATLAAFTAQPASLRGAEARACDPRFDDLVAPEIFSPAVRGLFAHTGNALDVAVHFDLKRANANPLPPQEPIARMIGALGQQAGVQGVQVYVAPIGRACIPIGSSPPIIVVGDGLLSTDDDFARAFLVIRALKLLQTRTAALSRVSAVEATPLLAAWLRAFVPQWTPQGPSAAAVTEMARKLAPALPRALDPSVGMMAVEAVGSIGNKLPAVAPAAVSWANRTALLAVGDPNAALSAIAWLHNQPGAPSTAQERANWIVRTPEAKDLIGFSVSEGYAEARAKLGLA